MSSINNKLTVREFTIDDVNFIVDYFYNATDEFLLGMGAIKEKLPKRTLFYDIIYSEVEKKYRNKNLYYIIWLLNNEPVGHSHINKINFGKEAYMHLHLWKNPNRQKGLGSAFVKETLPYYFKNFQLENLFCEPYAENPSPNKTLLKVGFDFVKGYETIPGTINFHQKVNQYILSREKFITLFS
ncbi:RimJ/RimL family protein N-acetyltransferase [Lutibacter sp. Hel_I_33_5]|uniref:GNAT family N-acetyltransferase n=1 Tax=Lutibacter sp. Hel_I_33_5 TaxID=1566289 RepID=UPI0011ABC773|nr:GNAT family protein [Lutibacter sp. Hel_I_33_5]TVZ55573.1 RimJ/RimL family protein N-acetyltransferase [Lutibacter sp. Hel_I_33_5]